MSGTIYVSPTPDGTHVASVAELPGCFARGATRDEAVARVRDAFRDYVALLRAHGFEAEHVRDLDPATFVVQDPEARGTFPEDFHVVHAHELRDFLHQYEATHAGLLALLEGLAREDFEREPAAGEYTVRACLEHIMATEATLLARLETWPNDGLGSFKSVHRLVAQRFGVMGADDAQGERRVRGQRWNAKKVMRRVLEHQYEHLAQIRDTLARIASR